MRLAILILLVSATYAAESGVATVFEAERASVHVTVTLEQVVADQAVLRALFRPLENDPPLHIYGKDLQEGTNKGGVPTKIAILPGQSAEATGPLSADKESHPDKDGLPVYPEGPVTLTLPIRLPEGPAGGTADTKVRISYLACTPTSCLQRVSRIEILKLPTAPRALKDVPRTVPEPQQAIPAAVDTEEIRRVVRDELAAFSEHMAERGATAIAWRTATSVADAERLIEEAHAAGKSALLDFTGPSCSTCLQMKKTVLRLPDVVAAWNAQVPIEIDTDAHDELGAWQSSRFGTAARPLYVRVDEDGRTEKWSAVFSVKAKDMETRKSFVAFLRGGTGSDAGLGANRYEFLLLAIFGGLFTLIMPCTYPMIPFTVNFFAKQAAGGRRLAPLALFYALGIVLCFTGLGVIVTGVFHKNLTTLAGKPITNLVFAALFIVLGLSLLGAFVLRLPAALAGSAGGGRGGYLGALVMGLTFAITAFSCTAPFAGTVLSQAVATGTWTGAVLGMAVYSGTIAIPFFLLALSPGLLHRLPKAGEWMNEFKVVGGLVEIAAAFKFLAICDNAWGWGVIGRTFTIASWSVIAAVIGAYVFGRIRLHDDSPVTSLGVGRLLIGISFLILALWLASGLFGVNLGVVESWFPADAAP
jgi:thiol:disulfide interchange protein